MLAPKFTIKSHAISSAPSAKTTLPGNRILARNSHFRHLLLSYKTYYNETRTNLSLSKDAPLPRTVQPIGPIFSVPILGGLHHQYGGM